MPEWAKSLFVTASWGATALNSLVALGVLIWRVRCSAIAARREPRPPGIDETPANSEQERRLGGGVVFAAVVAGMALCFAETLTMIVTGKVFGGFGPIRLVFLSAAFVPTVVLLGTVVAWLRGVRLSRAAAVVLLAILVPPLIITHAAFIAPYQWVIERAEVPLPRMDRGAAPIRVVVLADVQTDVIGWAEQRAFDLTLAEKPDIVLLPGDFFQGPDSLYERWESAWHAWMSRLNPPYGAYACMGNIDPVERGDRLFAGTPVKLLRDEVVEIDVRGTRVAIGGVEWKFDSPTARAARRKLSASAAAVRLLMAHTPDAVLVTDSDLQADLVVSGHTHGGQIVIPGFGPPLTFAQVPRDVGAGGLHRVDGRLVYVSRGVGFERGIAPPMRFFCPPEISVLTLRADNGAARATDARP